MGRRKFWHMLGTVLLLFAFPLVYVYPLLLPENTDAFRHFTIHLVVYVFLIAMFQMAWAMVQVSHVSLITDLTSVQNERVALNAYRCVCNCKLFKNNFTFLFRSYLKMHYLFRHYSNQMIL